MSELAAIPVCSNHPDVSEGVHRCTRCARPFCSSCLVFIGGHPYCASCKNEQLLDVRSGVDASVLPLASLGRRFLGNLVDVLPLVAITMYLAFRGAMGGRVMQRFDLPVILIGVGFLAYDALMIQFRSQTLGKMAVGTKVVRIDGSRVTPAQAWIRAVSRFALNYLYVVDWIVIFFTKERLCVHDMIAKTRVVNTD